MPSALSRIREGALPRLVDRVAGTPLLWTLGLLRRRRALPQAPRRFGLMMFETIGDTLLAGTLPASLRAAIPGAEIVVFASRGNRGAVELFDGIAQVVEVPLTQPAAAIAAIRSVPVDVMIDIGQWPRWYALLCALSRSRFTIGFATPGQGRHYAYDSTVPHGSDVHELENFQRLLAPLCDVHPAPPARALKPVGLAPAALAQHAPYVILHPWASGFRYPSREWPLARWAEIAQRAAGAGMSVFVSGAPADRDKAARLVAACAPGLPVRSLAGELSLPQLAAALQGAAAVVAVNTGVMHLAGVLGAPLVALHGPTSRRRWGPVGGRSIALAPDDPAGCEFLNLGFEYPPGPVDCMERISVNAVSEALFALAGVAQPMEQR
ncbi:glycosyltransferase family 9 protein [Ramlibacter sp. G-1-2-2]|uniref:Glycosyltransferase family 9 protein n=1 Tax=Ramlibacter agri TaxID=2728837 RepID=A0A848GZF4_9BURK|nr:glycosyltransferase family 9 protein [Ramlibacter agri]NML42712.1 glycosyltransferase family 9 protein [Ramlibacter agri]